jgi:hypothetical protein
MYTHFDEVSLPELNIDPKGRPVRIMGTFILSSAKFEMSFPSAVMLYWLKYQLLCIQKSLI